MASYPSINNAIKAQQLEQAARGEKALGFYGVASFNDIANKINRGVMTSTSDHLNAFCTAWRERWTRRPGLNTFHRQIAEKAQHAMVLAYKRQYPKSAKDPQLERANAPGKWRRYSQGAMVRALRSPNQIAYGYDGVGLLNPGELDSTAKQWYRLNFGAGRNATMLKANASKRQNFVLRPFGQEVGRFELGALGPSRPAIIPSGHFVKGSFLPSGFIAVNDAAHAPLPKGTHGPTLSHEGRGLSRELKIKSLMSAKAVQVKGPLLTKGQARGSFIQEGMYSLKVGLEKGWEAKFREWFAEAGAVGAKASNPVIKAGMSPSFASGLLESFVPRNLGGNPGLALGMISQFNRISSGKVSPGYRPSW